MGIPKCLKINNMQRTWITLSTECGRTGVGEVAPLPGRSKESLAEAKEQLQNPLKVDSFFPSVAFGIESALIDAFAEPMTTSMPPLSALLMGTPDEIRQQAEAIPLKGRPSAKLKVGNLSFKEAFLLIEELRERFFLRIDVNRAWKIEDSLRFFAQFPHDAFDYIEEPCSDPRQLHRFSHPFAIDESFGEVLSLEEIGALPLCKALVYKPTLQGGIVHAAPLQKWAKEHGIDFVLSCCFESEIGLAAIARMGQILNVTAPMGLGLHTCTRRGGHTHSKASCPAHLSNASIRSWEILESLSY